MSTRVVRRSGFEPRILEFKSVESDKITSDNGTAFHWQSGLGTNSLILSPGTWFVYILLDGEDLGFSSADVGVGLHAANGDATSTTPTSLGSHRFLSEEAPDEEFYRIGFTLSGAVGGMMAWIIRLHEEDEVFGNVGFRQGTNSTYQVQMSLNAWRIQ